MYVYIFSTNTRGTIPAFLHIFFLDFWVCVPGQGPDDNVCDMDQCHFERTYEQECRDKCMQLTGCLGFDWTKQNSPSNHACRLYKNVANPRYDVSGSETYMFCIKASNSGNKILHSITNLITLMFDLPKSKRYFQPHVLVNQNAGIVSSSVWLDNPRIWGPHFAIDGIYSKTNGRLFRSSRQDRPWLQWHLGKTTTLKALRIRNRADCCGRELRDIEIWAGEVKGSSVTDQTKCGKFDGPGEKNQQYDVKCLSPLSANFIVIQKKGLNVILQINELAVNPPAIGKKQNKGIIYIYIYIL